MKATNLFIFSSLCLFGINALAMQNNTNSMHQAADAHRLALERQYQQTAQLYQQQQQQMQQRELQRQQQDAANRQFLAFQQQRSSK